jgi:hypothetical protein
MALLMRFDDGFFEEEMAPEGEEGQAMPEGEPIPDDVSPEDPEG